MSSICFISAPAGDHSVPSADSGDNVNSSDVIGNKMDTNAGDSLVALYQVPAADSADNATIRDVVGNKTDPHGGNSLAAFAHKIDDHSHKSQFVFPVLADAVAVATGAGAWELGNFVEIIPANTIDEDFDLHFVFATMDADGLYIVNLYDGAGVLITQAAPSRDDKKSTDVQINLQTPIQPANTKIQAKSASASGGDSVSIKLYYHRY